MSGQSRKGASTKRRTADSWTDVAGRSYSPGDLVAISIINGRSPQTVIARVERIFLDDSKGKPYQETEYDHVSGEWKGWPSCSVQATPLLDVRGFRRYSEKKVSYSIPDNILKLDVTEDQLQRASEHRQQKRKEEATSVRF